MQILAEPSLPEVIPTMYDINVGESATFHCYSKYPIEWIFERKSTSSKVKVHLNSNMIKLDNAQLSDMGHYTCQNLHGKGLDIGVLTVTDSKKTFSQLSGSYIWWPPLPFDHKTPNLSNTIEKIELMNLPKDELGVHRISRRRRRRAHNHAGNYSTKVPSTFYTISAQNILS